MNYKNIHKLIILIILLEFNLTFANDCEFYYKAIFFGDDGKDIIYIYDVKKF